MRKKRPVEPVPNRIGYARVSTNDQNTALQLRALKAAGVKKIYSEKRGATRHRPELQRLLDDLKIGDELVVYKLDRLARSLRHLLQILEHLETRGCGLRSLTEPIDTSTAAGRMMIQILGAVAEFERSLIVERSIAGQRAAVANGAVVGRPRGTDAATEEQIRADYATGDFTQKELAAAYDLSPSQIKRAIYRTNKPLENAG